LKENKPKIQKSHRKRTKSRKKGDQNQNQRKEKANSKYVRFNIENNNNKRGKTPSNKYDKVKKFKFEEDSPEEKELETKYSKVAQYKNQANYREINEIGMQYNQNKHNNSLLICKINKVENLKIVHTTKD